MVSPGLHIRVLPQYEFLTFNVFPGHFRIGLLDPVLVFFVLRRNCISTSYRINPNDSYYRSRRRAIATVSLYGLFYISQSSMRARRMAKPVIDAQVPSAEDANTQQKPLDITQRHQLPEHDPNHCTETVVSTPESCLSFSSVFPEAFEPIPHNEDEDILNSSNRDALNQNSDRLIRLSDELEDHARTLTALEGKICKLRDQLSELAIGLGHHRQGETSRTGNCVESTAPSYGSRRRRRSVEIEGSGGPCDPESGLLVEDEQDHSKGRHQRSNLLSSHLMNPPTTVPDVGRGGHCPVM